MENVIGKKKEEGQKQRSGWDVCMGACGYHLKEQYSARRQMGYSLLGAG